MLRRISKRRRLAVVVLAGLAPLWWAFGAVLPTAAAGVVTDCVNHAGPNGFYTKLGGGGLVTFDCPGGGPIVLTIGEIIPASNTTIDGTNGGNRIILSGGNANRLFHQLSNGGTLNLMHLTLRDGNSGGAHGGCILNEAIVQLTDVLVTHCKTTGSFDGGGIYSGPGDVLFLYNSQVISNTARRGGGIFSNYFIYSIDSQIHDNRAAEWGGGIYQETSAPPDVVTLRNTSISNNVSAQRGGGIAAFAPMILTNVIVQGNYSETDGGGIYSQAPLTLTRVSISTNRAGPGPFYGLGGGMYNSGWVTGTEVTFSGNIGDSGGGLFNAPGAVGGLMFYATFTDNWVKNSGGGVFNNSGAFQILTGTFSNNYATTYGGAVYGYGGVVRLDQTALNQNKAGVHGGAIFNKAYMSIFGARLSGNSASQRGGGAYNQSAFSLGSATLDGNSAPHYGGGIYTENDATSLTNVTLSGNTAGVGGGGLYASSGRADLRNVTISNNAAPSGGGVVVVSGAALFITNTIIAHSAQGGNCTGAMLAASQYSLSSDLTCNLAGWLVRPNPNNVDPLLTGLGNYGGPLSGGGQVLVHVHMPKAGSPAIDGVVGANAPMFDARMVSRPQGAGFDIGAVERKPGDSDLAPRLFLPLMRR